MIHVMHMSLWSKWGSKYSLVDAPVLVAFIHLIMKVRLAQGHCSALSVCHRAVIKRFTHTTYGMERIDDIVKLIAYAQCAVLFLNSVIDFE